MSSTYYDVPEKDKHLLTTGYNEKSGKETSWNFGAFNACGGLKSNMNDMLIYLKAHMNDLNKDFALSHLQTFQPAHIGLIWVLEPFTGHTMIWHNGQSGGFRSFCGYIKDKKTGVVILSNSGIDVDYIARELLKFSLKTPI